MRAMMKNFFARCGSMFGIIFGNMFGRCYGNLFDIMIKN